MKKLARAFEICGDFECQKEIALISIHLLHGRKCESFDSRTEHGMKTIKTLFPKRSEEILQLADALVKLHGNSSKRFTLVVDFVRQSNALLGSAATVFSYECEKIKFGEYEVADNLAFQQAFRHVFERALGEGRGCRTAVDVLEDNMRVANFELSTNTLTIGIYQKCDGMLEKDAFDAKDNSWISLRFKAEDVPGVKNCVRVYAESGNCKAMKS